MSTETNQTIFQTLIDIQSGVPQTPPAPDAVRQGPAVQTPTLIQGDRENRFTRDREAKEVAEAAEGKAPVKSRPTLGIVEQKKAKAKAEEKQEKAHEVLKEKVAKLENVVQAAEKVVGKFKTEKNEGKAAKPEEKKESPREKKASEEKPTEKAKRVEKALVEQLQIEEKKNPESARARELFKHLEAVRAAQTEVVTARDTVEVAGEPAVLAQSQTVTTETGEARAIAGTETEVPEVVAEPLVVEAQSLEGQLKTIVAQFHGEALPPNFDVKDPEQVLKFFEAQAVKLNREVVQLKKELALLPPLDPKRVELSKKIEALVVKQTNLAKGAEVALSLSKNHIAQALNAGATVATRATRETAQTERDRTRETREARRQGSPRTAAMATSQSAVTRRSSSGSAENEAAASGGALFGSSNSVSDVSQVEGESSGPAAPASLTAEGATFVSAQSLGDAAATSEGQLLASIASTGTMLSIQSSNEQMRSEIRKTDDILKQFVRKFKDGRGVNLDDVVLACIVSQRRETLGAVRVATSVFKFLEKSDETIQALTDQLATIDGGAGASQMGQLAGINTQLQQKLGDKQMAQNILKESLNRVQQSVEFVTTLQAIKGRMDQKGANLLGQG